MVRQITESLICGLIGGAIMLLIVANSPVHQTDSSSQVATVSIEG